MLRDPRARLSPPDVGDRLSGNTAAARGVLGAGPVLARRAPQGPAWRVC